MKGMSGSNWLGDNNTAKKTSMPSNAFEFDSKSKPYHFRVVSRSAAGI